MSHRLTRRTWAALGILLVAIPALMAVFVCVWDERKYYLTSLLLVGLMFVPFVLRFEGRRPQARELVLLATMTALAVAGRAAFYWLPQCKPVCAIVILTAVAFTPEAGFVTGAAAGLISNFFFGQGPWTPWQMLGFGLVGFLGGVLFAGRKVRLVPLLLYGFFSVLILRRAARYGEHAHVQRRALVAAVAGDLRVGVRVQPHSRGCDGRVSAPAV